LGADNGGCAYGATGDSGMGGAVGGVEAAGEAAEDFLGWVVGGGGEDGAGLVFCAMLEGRGLEEGRVQLYGFNTGTQWFLAKDV
jgi:hypothetical protein